VFVFRYWIGEDVFNCECWDEKCMVICGWWDCKYALTFGYWDGICGYWKVCVYM